MVDYPDNIALIEVHVTGNAFQERRSSLPSVVNILNGYEQSFQFCLNEASLKFTTNELPRINTTIALTSTASGTLTVQTIVEALPGIVPVLPQIVDYGWQLYQKAQELIKVASMFFNKYERPIDMHIENSPNAALILIINQDHSATTLTPDVLDAARATHKPLNIIAKEVADENADSVLIASQNNNELIDINRENHKLYRLPHKTLVDESPITMECALYSLNKYSSNGRLELFDGETTRLLPFTIKDGNISDYIDGLGANKSTVTATREMQTNALGEKTIKKLHLLGIQNNQNLPGDA